MHNHPHTCRQIYIYIYIYTYIHHAQCYHTEQESKTNIAIPRERGLSKEQEKIKGTTGGGTLIHALEKRLREREKEKTILEGLGPLIYKKLPIVGLHPFACILALFAYT